MKLKKILKNELFCDGDWVESKDQDPTGEIRLIQLADIGDGEFLNKSNRFINRPTAEKLRCTYLEKDDILIARMPDPLGRACLFPFEEKEKYATVVDVAILRPNGTCNKKYLQYILNSPFIRHEIFRQSTGSTRIRITRKKLGELNIPLPPLKTQQKIAAILYEADRLRQLNKQLIEKYEQLSQSLFLEMFGDPVSNLGALKKHRLGSVSTKITDGTHHSPKQLKEGYPYVTAKHVKPFRLSFDNKATYISKEAHDEIYKRCSPEFGDVLYIKDGATTGIACLNTFKEPISLLSSLALIKPKKDILNSIYLCYWLNHEGIKQKLLSEFMSGAAIQRYTLKKINSFPITLPDIARQHKFAARIIEIEKQKTKAQKSLAHSEDLFNSLLQRAFKGELVKE